MIRTLVGIFFRNKQINQTYSKVEYEKAKKQNYYYYGDYYNNSHYYFYHYCQYFIKYNMTYMLSSP